jgi:hypothetical protein
MRKLSEDPGKARAQQNRWIFWAKFLLVMNVPLTFVTTHFWYLHLAKYQLGLAVELLFCLGLPVSLVSAFALQAVKFVCPKCARPYYSGKNRTARFRLHRPCSNCSYDLFSVR